MTDQVRVYLDTNVFIYALEGDSSVAEPVKRLLTELARYPRTAVTSELTLAEVLVMPERKGLTGLKRSYMELLIFSKFIDLRPISRSILLESAKYRAVVHSDRADPAPDRRNFLPDAIHVVTAREAQARFFVGRDSRIRVPVGMTNLAPDSGGVDAILRLLPP